MGINENQEAETHPYSVLAVWLYAQLWAELELHKENKIPSSWNLVLARRENMLGTFK